MPELISPVNEHAILRFSSLPAAVDIPENGFVCPKNGCANNFLMYL
jgi:hypothetical protein